MSCVYAFLRESFKNFPATRELFFSKVSEKPFLKILGQNCDFYFLHTHSESFYQAVLQIKSQIISRIEAAKDINQLKGNSTQKQSNQLLPYTARSLLVKLKDSGTDIDDEFFKTTIAKIFKQVGGIWSSKYG